ncbi:heterogeneous nuclear ribonucleoprotein U-like protein 1 isoform X2 [Scaptodrosophila lebanonensis]|uniref:Heterogeneous nuclear ribonucleoprotein U-like protein 1 isoform X2 n=1 Tax=Drosophila lebanonensis TaxID=7225 RepID=A0A6J2TJ17_DROLE|nr:heterogeneous nuclear ribonucleoprotein U-like protein 1 isoform X2 [Scaptodrosophila lebanonensis]
MDLAKLEKMKVVDLRNELQARGLDTKGVKAVLVERLRAHVEGSGAGGGDGDGTPVTPSRRQRRTRSMSRSPSPVAAAPVATEPELETLAEEEQPTEIVDDSEAEEAVETHAEADDYENEQEAVKASETDQAAEAGPQSEHEQDNDEDIRFQHNTAGEQNVHTESHESSEDAETGEPYKESGEQDQRATEVTVENGQKMDVDQEDNFEKGIDQDGDTAATSTHDQEQEKDKTDKTDKPHDDSRSTSERRKRSHSHTRSRTGSRSPKRRSGDKRDSKVVEERSVPEDEPIIADKQVGLSWLDSDLHLRIDANNYTSAKPLNAEIYSLIWSGARANYGVREGKVCYEVRLSEESQPENSHHFRDEPHVRGFRVGFSTPKSSLLLGEAEHSYGYCESGRKASNSEFTEYGKPYQLDDVIGCYLDLDSTPCHIKYTLNGEDLGVAFEFDKSVLGEEDALFPHIVTKGYEYIVNFADGENLLVNAERPTRKRRKPRKESVKEDDEGEKWKVLDEATADDDELEKKDEKEEKPETEQGDAETVEEASESVVAENTEQSEKQQAESPTAMDTGEPDQNQNATNAEDEVKAADEPIGVINGDSEKRTDESAASEPSAAEQTEKSVEQADDDEEDGPSPNKRSKTDESEKEAASSVAAEDEYEDVVPLPRETAALLPGYVLIALVPVEQLIAGPQRAESRKECEVILLVGLPGAGKTHWTQKHVAENAEKRYEIIGPDAIIAKMTIDGASRKTVHKGRWDKVYEICLNSLGGLEDIAMKRRRNFILDQPISRCPRLSLAGLMTSSIRS